MNVKWGQGVMGILKNKHWIERWECKNEYFKKREKSVLGLGSGNKGSGVCEP